MITNKTIKRNIRKAISIFYKDDSIVLIKQAHEQNVAYMIACYLMGAFPCWDVNVVHDHRRIKGSSKINQEKYVHRPVIIIHELESNGRCLAMILLKCEWNKDPIEEDLITLENNKNKFHNQIAFFLEIKSKGYMLKTI